MLTKKSKIIILLFVLLVGALIFLEANEAKPINWFPSYAKTDKIPLGTFVSYQLIKDSYEVKDVNKPPYEFMNDTDSIQGNYVFVNNTVTFDNAELEKILQWVERGNILFIATKNFSKNLLDTLNLKIENKVALDNTQTQPLVSLTNQSLDAQNSYHYDRNRTNPYFSAIDTSTAIALGKISLYKDSLKVENPEINYIKQPFGRGEILLHTFPEAFGNYFMLKDQNFEYTQNVLSYLDIDKNIFWDNYYKAGKIYYTPLYLVLSNSSLTWAYYFLLIGAFLFIIFEGKRKQRSIPIIKPLKNQTVAFTRTISGMFFEKRKHKEIATKQNVLFLEYIRDELRIPTNDLNEKILKDIAARSNNSIEATKEIFRFFSDLNTKKTVTKEELIELTTLISQYKEQV